jgi:hypothetical protein
MDHASFFIVEGFIQRAQMSHAGANSSTAKHNTQNVMRNPMAAFSFQVKVMTATIRLNDTIYGNDAVAENP